MEYKGTHMIKMIWKTKIKIGGFIPPNIKIMSELGTGIKIDFVQTNGLESSPETSPLVAF